MTPAIKSKLDEMKARRERDADDFDLVEYFNGTVDEHAKLEESLRVAVEACEAINQTPPHTTVEKAMNYTAFKALERISKILSSEV